MGRNIILSTVRKETYATSTKRNGGTMLSKKKGPVSRERYASLSAMICSGVARFNMRTMTVPMMTERVPMV
jgi:hypothetical protein